MELQTIAKEGYELVVQARDAATGLNAIICVHRTIDGRSAGGCRMWQFASEAEMLKTATRLAKTMTYKAEFSDIPLGGGKAVLMGDPLTDKTPELYRAMGRFIECFNTEYFHGNHFYTGKDVGTELEDIETMKQTTSYVMDHHFISGNSSLFTAYGLYQGISAALAAKGLELADCHIAIQGAGAVAHYLLAGFPDDAFFAPARAAFPGLIALCKHIMICDVRAEQIEHLKDLLEQDRISYKDVLIVPPERIYDQAAEIFMPCALGNVLTLDNVALLQRSGVQIVVGSANSQLPEPDEGVDHYAIADQALFKAGILYVPDYAVNVGGLGTISYELQQHIAGQPFVLAEAITELDKIQTRLRDIFRRSQTEGVPTGALADRIAEAKMRQHHILD